MRSCVLSRPHIEQDTIQQANLLDIWASALQNTIVHKNTTLQVARMRMMSV